MLRRTRLQRKTPLRADPEKARAFVERGRKEIPRHKPMNRVNKTRKRARFARAYHSPGFCAWVRSLGCAVPSCWSERIEVAHVRSRAAGGTWEDCLPLCADHHRLAHTIGHRSLEQQARINLADVAAATALRWKAFTRTEG